MHVRTVFREDWRPDGLPVCVFQKNHDAKVCSGTSKANGELEGKRLCTRRNSTFVWDQSVSENNKVVDVTLSSSVVSKGWSVNNTRRTQWLVVSELVEDLVVLENGKGSKTSIRRIMGQESIPAILGKDGGSKASSD